jgi:hypothetical protein
MAGPLTPPTNFLLETQIEEFRSQRKKTDFKACTQVTQFFIKADGTMSCSCMRYWDILADMRTVNAAEFFNGPMMRYIRESFAAGYEPFHFCDGCASRLSTPEVRKLEYEEIGLHVEPSNRCNLYCEECICTYERSTSNTPVRVDLEFELYEKSLREIAAAGISVRYIALVGFGEPLFNSRTPDMARLGRELFPTAWIYVDTNANFGMRRAQELANCGISEVRLALDGIDQDSYEGYRRNGEFHRALQFAQDLAEEIRRTKSYTRALWKYILFDHNDRDEQLLAAVRMAGEIGVPIAFDATVGAKASKRLSADIEALVGQPIGCNIDPSSTVALKFDLGEPEQGSPLWRRLSRLRRRAADVRPHVSAPS